MQRRRGRAWVRIAVLAATLGVTAACANLSGLTGGVDAGDAGHTGTHDGAVDARRTTDAGPDVSARRDAPRMDAPVDASADVAVTYGDFTAPASWQTFDVSTLDMNAGGFSGGAFDGTHIYLSPSVSSVVAQYDTTQSFADASGGWTTFDMANLPSSCNPCAGAVFDGTYVYFVPGGGVITRFDTRRDLAAISAWSTFDPSTLPMFPDGGLADLSYQGAAFDGRFVYFAPYLGGMEKTDSGNHPLFSGKVIRFDTMLAFASATAWSTFDVATVSPQAVGFEGAVFDGRYVYFMPNENTVVARVDTQGAFAVASSWSTFDVGGDAGADVSFSAGAFDGRYVYVIPGVNLASVVERYDTHAAFDAATSWESFDTTTVSPNAYSFFGAAFDGRYLYLSPFDEGADGLVAQYDTEASFTDPSAWAVFDTVSINANAQGFNGTVFDGENVYFVPNTNQDPNEFYNGVVARFDSRHPPLPQKLPTAPGSFY